MENISDQSVIEYRRALHRIPELGNQLPETCAYVRGVLDNLDCEIFSPAEGSVCAWFDFGKQETVAFRADMDALPVTECSGVSFTSNHPGIMHACGHDGHTAMLLALAGYIRESSPPRNVLLLFQPAEESTGGAEPLCKSGIFTRYGVSRIFGLHIWPNLDKGVMYTRPGALMARSSEVTFTVKGRSVHISRAAQGLDAMTAGIACLQKSYAMMENIDKSVPQILRFGKMTSGTVRNAVSGETVLEGSLRTYQDDVFEQRRANLQAIAEEVAEESGCDVQLKLSTGYPAVWNHEVLYQHICESLGTDAPKVLAEPVLASEDFSFYQKLVPGVFFFLGAGSVPELHAPDFVFDDEAILPKGLAFLRKLLVLD